MCGNRVGNAHGPPPRCPAELLQRELPSVMRGCLWFCLPAANIYPSSAPARGAAARHVRAGCRRSARTRSRPLIPERRLQGNRHEQLLAPSAAIVRGLVRAGRHRRQRRRAGRHVDQGHSCRAATLRQAHAQAEGQRRRGLPLRAGGRLLSARRYARLYQRDLPPRAIGRARSRDPDRPVRPGDGLLEREVLGQPPGPPPPAVISITSTPTLPAFLRPVTSCISTAT
jgi:hypothetical protein